MATDVDIRKVILAGKHALININAYFQVLMRTFQSMYP